MGFWDRALACKHESISPNYYVSFGCGTPYCRGYQSHCLDCGVYISECGCGFNNGMSGWSHLREKRFREKKELM